MLISVQVQHRRIFPTRGGFYNAGSLARVSLWTVTMEDRKKKPTDPQAIANRSRAEAVPEEGRPGPPARETTYVRGDRAREVEGTLAEHTSTSPGLAGGDMDADWQRADSVGEEAPGGTEATPDQDIVDAAGDALGVSRAPDEEFRSSTEILESRDRNRNEQEE